MTKTNSNPLSSPMDEPLATFSSLPASPALSMTTIEEKNEPTTHFIVDDVELLSILASNANVHADNQNVQTPTMAILDWEDWNQDVPEFVNNNKRKRNDNDDDLTPSVDSDDDEEDEFNFLDQFDFVDVSFDHPPLTESNKKQKTTTTTDSFVDENADDLSALLKQSDSLMAELDCSWVLDITS